MYRAMLTFRWGISSAENSSYDADLNVKWRSWFEGPDGSAYYFNQDLIRYDSGDGCGVLCLCENPVVEPGLDPQTLPSHLTKHLLNLSETPSNWNFVRHLKNIRVVKLDSSMALRPKWEQLFGHRCKTLKILKVASLTNEHRF